MPYTNVPEELWGKMDSCVEQVMSKQPDLEKPRAIAICHAQIVKEKAEASTTKGAWETFNDFLTGVTDWLKAGAHKQQSLDKESEKIRSAFRTLFPNQPYGPSPWLVEVFTDSVVAQFNEKYYRIGYSKNENGITFNPQDTWEQVESSWVKTKAGARHSRTDVADLQTIHDKAVGLGAECMGRMSVVKQADGKLRWLTFSSTAYRDRDGEIVSTKALSEDVARADVTKDFGPLRFWHVPGVELGECDYNALAGRVLVESGTFRDQAIGQAIKEHADEYGVSLGFYHPTTDPDKDGVYNTVRRFERSLLPDDKASNLFTQLSVKESKMEISTEKREALEKLVGKETADKLLAQAEGVQKQADAAGVAFKETPLPDPAATEKARKMSDMMAGMDEEQYMAYMAKAFAPFIEKAIHAAMGAKEDTETEAQKAQAALDGKFAGVETALKESTATQKALADLLKTLGEQQTKIAGDVAELMGETPRAAKGFRASQADETLRQKAAPVYAGPVIDESFGAFVTGQVTK